MFVPQVTSIYLVASKNDLQKCHLYALNKVNWHPYSAEKKFARATRTNYLKLFWRLAINHGTFILIFNSVILPFFFLKKKTVIVPLLYVLEKAKNLLILCCLVFCNWSQRLAFLPHISIIWAEDYICKYISNDLKKNITQSKGVTFFLYLGYLQKRHRNPSLPTSKTENVILFSAELVIATFSTFYCLKLQP